MHASKPLVELFGLTFDLSIILTSTVTALIVVSIAYLSTRNLRDDSPGLLQNFMEWIIEFIQGIMRDTIGVAHNVFIISTGVTLLLYIFIGNTLGIPFTIITGEEHRVTWWLSPTADAHVTMTLAIMMIVYTHFIHIRLHGWKRYFSSYFKPFKALVFINILEQFCTTITLGLRLFGNIYAGELMLGILVGTLHNGLVYGAITAFPIILWQAYCIFIGGIQAFIFVTLTMVYIGHRMNEAH